MDIKSILKNRIYRIIAIVFLVAGLAVSAFFLLESRINKAQSWYNVSWLYRKQITVGNTGSTQTNIDVLITLDTATLIGAGKMQSDCDDIRVIDSDDTTTLTHWVEYGCNTSVTQLWARIPSLSAGGETIYVYYGNSGAAGAQESWTGKFLVFADATCPTGWSANSDLSTLRYPYGASSYGTNGGSSTSSHAQVSGTSGTPSAQSTISSDTSTTVAITGHTHTLVKADITDNTDVKPPYLDMIFCEATNPYAKQNIIVMFDNSVPSGWTRFSAMDSYIPRKNSSYGGTGGATTHTHSFTGSYTTGGPNNTTNTRPPSIMESGVYVGSSSHTHSSTSGTTGSGNNMPPYLTMVFGKKSTADAVVTVDSILMSSAVPPRGWTQFSALDSSFPYGSATYGTGYATSTHSHSITITTGSPSATYQAANVSGTTSGTSTHTHSYTGTTDNDSNLPLYETVYYVQKNDNSLVGVSTSVGSEEDQTVNAPTIGTPSPQSTTSMRWNFTDNATNETGFKVYDSGGTLKVTCPSPNLTYCDESSLSSNTAYQRKVKAYNATTESGFSSLSVAKYTHMPAPTLSFGTKTSTSLELSASGLTNITSGTSGAYFDCTGASCDGGINEWIQSSSDTATSLSVNTQYTFQVKGRNGDSVETSYSSTQSAYTLANVPLIPSVSPLTSSTAQFYLNSNQNGNPSTTEFAVYDTENSLYINPSTGLLQAGIAWATYTNWGGASGVTITGLTDDLYSFSAKARNGDSVNTDYGPAVTLSFSTPATTCWIKEVANGSQITLYWRDTSSSEDGWTIQRKVDGGAFADLLDPEDDPLAPGTTSYVDSTTSIGYTYTYRVTYVISGVNGVWCTTIPKEQKLGGIKINYLINLFKT